MTKIEKAIHFVTDAMSGQTRKGNNTPAVFHSLECGAIASTLTNDEDIISAAILHDVIEDANVTKETLRLEFLDRTTDLVLSETENKRLSIPPNESWKIRKQEAIDLLKNSDDIGVKILFLADKLSNIRSMHLGVETVGSAFFERFNQKDPKQHCWYFREIANGLEELKNTPAFKEYNNLIKITFNEE